MGIQGLLPLLKSIQHPTELKKFAGETFAVDAYCWLHQGAVSCAIELAQGKPTRKYVNFAMNRVRMCKHFGVTPYLVFDGDYLPSKAITEASRAKRREETKKLGMELLKAGKPSQAHQELRKAVDVTPEMARHLIEELKKANLPYVVAPYEADAQMTYLERHGIVTGIISEDSDLLVFGARRLLTKLDQYGQCVEINRRDFCACREVSLTGWSDTDFRRMAILSGCDYLPSIGNMGLKTAYRMLRKHKTPEKVLKMLQFDGKYHVPPDYLEHFYQAERTFLYQRVFCPKVRELVHLTTVPSDVDVHGMPYIGGFVETEMARKVAAGDMNPITKRAIIISSSPTPRKRTASSASHVVQQSSDHGKPIDSYFKGDRRIPMGNMDPNCFSVDPERVATMTENGERPIVFPLPRPYVDEATSQAPRHSRPYINRPAASNSSRVLRRRTEPITSILHDEGLMPESSRQVTGQSVRGARSFEGPKDGHLVHPPSKKARLCDDSALDSEPSKERSKFFPANSKRTSGRRKTDGYIMSDDSVEEALRDLPDVDGWHKTSMHEDKVLVYEESAEPSNTTFKDDDHSTVSASGKEVSANTSSNASSTPMCSTISRFSFNQTGSASIAPHTRRSSYNRPTPPSYRSTDDPTPALTTCSSSTLSEFEETPGTPLMTPLQRLGAQAFRRKGVQPSTPSTMAPGPPKKSSMGRRSIDSLPVNPTFVPLPPVDVEELEALYQPEGSEDMLVPASENEDFTGEQENLGKKGNGVGKKLDLSRFYFASEA